MTTTARNTNTTAAELWAAQHCADDTQPQQSHAARVRAILAGEAGEVADVHVESRWPRLSDDHAEDLLAAIADGTLRERAMVDVDYPESTHERGVEIPANVEVDGGDWHYPPAIHGGDWVGHASATIRREAATDTPPTIAAKITVGDEVAWRGIVGLVQLFRSADVACVAFPTLNIKATELCINVAYLEKIEPCQR